MKTMRWKHKLSFILVFTLLLSAFPGQATLALSASAVGPAEMTVDLADRSLGPIFHGSAGALYALSEPNVPDINTLIPIKPSHITQKPPQGLQHPSGDGLRVADYFLEAGGEVVQIIMQDYYQRWYYPSRTATEYINEAVIPITTAVKAFKEEWALKNPGQDPDRKFIYIPYNEPEQNTTRYPSMNSNNATGRNSRATFNADWLAVTNAIKSIDPGAVISGPNLINYADRIMADFIEYCVLNDCLPDIVSWHLLSNRSYQNAAGNIAAFRELEALHAPTYAQLYPDRESPFPLKVDINEYASTAEIAVGGSLIQYIARYDELKMNSMLPYWNTANSYGSLLAGQNEPNGAWWLYKWYADMIGGDMAKIEIVKARDDRDAYGYGLYGLSSIDDTRQQVSLAFGGTRGNGRIVFKNVTGHAGSPAFLADAEQVHITVWYAGYTGLTGFLVEPTQIIDRNFDVIDGNVVLDLEIDDYTATYFAVLTPAVDSEPYEVWFERYEAEHAEIRTGVNEPTNVYPVTGSGRSSSNGRHIGGIDHPNSVVKFTNISVPEDGNYRLDIIEGSGSTALLPAQSGGGLTNQRQNSEFFIKIDDQPSFKIVLRADYSWQQLGMVTQFVNLTAGNHSIAISKYNQDTGEMGQGAATLDAIELTYNGPIGSAPNYRVQAEFAEYDAEQGLRRESVLPDFDGAGYITGYANPDAKTRFVLSVLEDGMYDVSIKLATDNTGELILDHDRQNVMNLKLNHTNGEWRIWTVRMFLRTGINLIDIKSTADLSLDYIHAKLANQNTTFTIEAEDALVVGSPAAGDPPFIREDVFAKYASGGKYAGGITSYDGEQRYLEIAGIDVPQAGRYKMVITYANGEYAGSHSYNNNVVERYAQISVNGGEPETVHFKNTISWQQFATATIDVELKKGRNTIRFSNNNSYDGGSNPYGGSNASGTEPFVYTVLVPKQYTPAFDRFDIYPLPEVVERNGKVFPDHPVIALNGDRNVKVNESFDLTLYLANMPKNSKEMQMTLSYDPEHLEYAGASALLQGMSVTAIPDQPNGEVMLTIKNTPEIIPGDVLTLHWRVKETEASSSEIAVTNVKITKAQPAQLNDFLVIMNIYADVAQIQVQGKNGADSITTNRGTLQMEASVYPANANQTVTWSVYHPDGNPADLATISSSGLLSAAGQGKNGVVKVVATAADGSGIIGEASIQITNQLLQLNGTPFGAGPSWSPGGEFDKAFDGDVNTFYDYFAGSGGFTGIDLGEGNEAAISQIRFYPRKDFPARMVGGKFQGSNEGPETGFVDLFTVTTVPEVGWNTITITDSTAYRYVRYVSPVNGYGNVAEIEFFTNP